MPNVIVHPYIDDGGYCAACNLPAANQRHTDNRIWIDTATGTWGSVNTVHGALVIIDADTERIPDFDTMADWEIAEYGKQHGKVPPR